MKSILDRGFRYTPSFSTDIRTTFERLRREELAAEPKRPRARVVHIAPQQPEPSPAQSPALPVARVA